MSDATRFSRTSLRMLLALGLVLSPLGCGSSDVPIASTPDQLVDAQKARAATLGGEISRGKSKAAVAGVGGEAKVRFTD